MASSSKNQNVDSGYTRATRSLRLFQEAPWSASHVRWSETAFHYNQAPGIHFKAAVSEEYREAILKGIKDGMSIRFPDFPATGSIWITEVTEHPVDSSQIAFYQAARCAIEEAYALAHEPHGVHPEAGN